MFWYYPPVGEKGGISDLLCDQFVPGTGIVTMRSTVKRTIPQLVATDNSYPLVGRALEEFRGYTYYLDNTTEQGIIYGIGTGEKVGHH